MREVVLSIMYSVRTHPETGPSTREECYHISIQRAQCVAEAAVIDPGRCGGIAASRVFVGAEIASFCSRLSISFAPPGGIAAAEIEDAFFSE